MRAGAQGPTSIFALGPLLVSSSTRDVLHMAPRPLTTARSDRNHNDVISFLELSLVSNTAQAA